MKRLSLEQIVAADDLGKEEIEMPEWDGTVVVRGLGYGEWVDLRDASTVNGQQDEKIFSRLLFAAAIVEPEITPEQADLLLNKSATAVNRLVEKIVGVSGVGDTAITDAEATFQDDA
jgi:hypothetical protein